MFIAREDYWNKRFKKAGLPIIGDDIKSQVGATIVHRALARLFHDRGVKLMRTSQLNVGGNMDFFNMLERERLESKKISKTNAVTSIMGHELPADDVHVGPSDYVPWLTDRKWAHIRLEGQAFGDVPLNIELKLEVWDSPNSAGIVIDAVRCCKLALNNGIAGQLDGPSSYLMKSPLQAATRRRGARADTEAFIANVRAHTAAAAAEQGASAKPRAAAAARGGTSGRDSRAGAVRARTPRAASTLDVSAERFAIAQVSPVSRWEARTELGDTTSSGSPQELAARGPPRSLVAPSQSRRRSFATELRGRCARIPRALLARATGTRSCSLAGEVLPFSPTRRRAGRPVDVARTIEELLVDRAARRRPRPRAVRAERGERRAAPLARAERRAASTRRPSGCSRRRSRGRFVELLFGRLDARIASYGATAALMGRFFPADYRVITPTADETPRRPRVDRARGADRVDRRRGGAGGAADLPARPAATPDRDATGEATVSAPRALATTPATLARAA